MTRKDYILIAKALLSETPGTNWNPNKAVQHDLDARAIARALKVDNPRFDEDHFLAVVRGEKDLNSRPTRCNHVPHNPDSMQTVCEKCGIEMDLR